MPEPAGLIHRTIAPGVGDAPHPAILLLHGRGSHELDLLSLGPALDARFFVVSARAPFAWMGGYRWYELEGPAREEAASFRHSLALLRAFVDNLVDAYPIDPSRLFLLGFSQGAMMSNALALTGPDRVAGAMLLSGFQPRTEGLGLEPHRVRGKPFFVAHGTHDTVLPVERGREARDTLLGLGADVTYREYEMDHEVIQEEITDLQVWLGDRLDASS